MKPLQLSLILLFSPLVFHAQLLTGLWMGKMTNDSNTVRKDDEYEIVLTEYKNKVYGYTRNTFFVDEKLFYIVKKVEGTINGNICEVSDVDVIMHNFPQKPERKVRVTYTFRRSPTDSTWNLDGEWKTNTTKRYYTISGRSDLSQEKDLSKAKIFPHLEELKETKDIAFYNDWKKEKETAIASNDKLFKQEFLKSLVAVEKERNTLASAVDKPAIAINTANKTAQPLVEIAPEEKKTDIALDKQIVGDSKTSATATKQPVQINTLNKTSAEIAEIKVEEKKGGINAEKQIASNSVAQNTKQPVQINTSNRTSAELTEIKTEPKKATVAIDKQTEESYKINPQTGYLEPTTVRTPQSIAKTTNPVNSNQPKQQVAIQEVKQSEVAITKANSPVINTDAAKSVADRDFDKPQEIAFTSDSLVLALYDNGEVDGDTVSVLLNGEVIIAKQCLKTTAFKKTIYVPKGEYQANIVLYAENLGVYPPNTGLLVVYDGEERHNIRFSADYKKNSAIVLKRKQ